MVEGRVGLRENCSSCSREVKERERKEEASVSQSSCRDASNELLTSDLKVSTALCGHQAEDQAFNIHIFL